MVTTQYQLRAESGVVVTADSKTLLGAKREATAWMSHGGGSVYIDDAETGETICKRKFWHNGNRFGWKKWQNV